MLRRNTSAVFSLNTSITYQFLSWFIGGAYIGGDYEGESEELILAEKEGGRIDFIPVSDKPKRTIKFTIKQNLFSISISGTSCEKGKSGLELVSQWQGYAFAISDEQYKFVVQLTTPIGAFGVLNIIFNGHKGQEALGFYNSAQPGGSAYRFSANKSERKQTTQ